MTDREKFEAWFAAERKELIERKVGIPTLAGIEDANWKVWRAAWQAAIASQQPADDGWIEWSGNISVNEQPVSGMVEITYRNGVISKANATMRFWGHQGIESDIIAYRVVKP